MSSFDEHASFVEKVCQGLKQDQELMGMVLPSPVSLPSFFSSSLLHCLSQSIAPLHRMLYVNDQGSCELFPLPFDVCQIFFLVSVNFAILTYLSVSSLAYSLADTVAYAAMLSMITHI